MTRGSQNSSEGLSGVDQILHDRIMELTQLTVSAHQQVSRLTGLVEVALTSIGKLDDGLMHLSKQDIGTTERLRRLEALMEDDPKAESLLWETWSKFTRLERWVVLVVLTAFVAAVFEPKEIKDLLLALVGAGRT